jgi:Zn-dependent protease with chaperone function
VPANTGDGNGFGLPSTPNPIPGIDARAAASHPLPGGGAKVRANVKMGASIDPPSQWKALEAELLAAFRGDIPRLKVPMSYRLGIAACTLVLLLLPISYVAMIGALIYFVPTIGAIIALFMIKPLFARRLMMGRRRSLTRQGEPVLFALVDRVCEAVGVRPPTRINVNWQLNAGAGFDEGWLPFFSNQLALSIGVPLVAILDIGEFAGVLAHEFGHFTQNSSRRMTYIVRSINNWFYRVVYERDTWDQRLAELAAQLNWRLSWILILIWLGIRLSRLVLWVLMMLAHVVSSFMSRQMEFHADAYEARLVGGAVFESTTRKVGLFGAIYQNVFYDLRRIIGPRTLPDDLTWLMFDKQRQIPPALLDELSIHIRKRKTNWLDTHPADQDRVRRAYREGRVPLFTDQRPATKLFSDFKALSRNTTWDFYRACFGTRFQPSNMQPAEEVIRPAVPPRTETLPPIPFD